MLKFVVYELIDVFTYFNDNTGQQKKKGQGLKISYFPNFGALILNLTIIFKFMEPILQCCQFRVFLVENYIFENISKF